MAVKNICIVGAGLVGSLCAIILRNRGYNVSIYERRSDPRKSGGLEGGRSINLALSNRGWRPLQLAGLNDEIERMVIPMKGRLMHDLAGELTFQPYGKEGEFINSISRSGLNELLMAKAESLGVNAYFDHVCKNVDHDQISIQFEWLGKEVNESFDLIIGSDGAYSAVRGSLVVTERYNYSQSYISHGYKELSIPPGSEGDFLIEKNALHIWPRGEFMLIALPNLDGSFTVTLFLDVKGRVSFEAIKDSSDVIRFFEQNFADTVPLIPTLVNDWNSNPTSSLVTVKCFPWVKNRTLLIGDAAHAIVPFYGQGMNCGFEDCRVLNDLLDETDDNWDEFLDKFQNERKPNGDAIADLALQNFVEMRDHVGSEEFLLRKKIEAKLHDLYPNQWIPQYSMVTFHDELSYSEALSIGEKQKQIMDEVMAKEGIHQTWESLDFQSLVARLN